MNATWTNIFEELFIEELVLLLIIAMVATVILLVTNYKLKKENNHLLEYSINVNAQINEEIPQILENMTHECFDEYMLLNHSCLGNHTHTHVATSCSFHYHASMHRLHD